jgi:hypothetical protein
LKSCIEIRSLAGRSRETENVNAAREKSLARRSRARCEGKMSPAVSERLHSRVLVFAVPILKLLRSLRVNGDCSQLTVEATPGPAAYISHVYSRNAMHLTYKWTCKKKYGNGQFHDLCVRNGIVTLRISQRLLFDDFLFLYVR